LESKAVKYEVELVLKENLTFGDIGLLKKVLSMLVGLVEAKSGYVLQQQSI